LRKIGLFCQGKRIYSGKKILKNDFSEKITNLERNKNFLF